MDSYNLLTVNRKEIDSSTKMFQKILLTAQFAIVLLLLCTFSYMAVSGFLACACLLGVVLAVSIMIIVVTDRPLVDASDITSHNEVEL